MSQWNILHKRSIISIDTGLSLFKFVIVYWLICAAFAKSLFFILLSINSLQSLSYDTFIGFAYSKTYMIHLLKREIIVIYVTLWNGLPDSAIVSANFALNWNCNVAQNRLMKKKSSDTEPKPDARAFTFSMQAYHSRELHCAQQRNVVQHNYHLYGLRQYKRFHSLLSLQYQCDLRYHPARCMPNQKRFSCRAKVQPNYQPIVLSP